MADVLLALAKQELGHKAKKSRQNIYKYRRSRNSWYLWARKGYRTWCKDGLCWTACYWYEERAGRI